jgi:hypothetical protein
MSKDKKIVPQKGDKWFYSRSRESRFSFKKIQGFEAWFYTGPSWHFGHPNDNKGRKARSG